MAERINLFDPAVRKNPYPVYDELLRLKAPQQVDPMGVWTISKYTDVQYALKHPEIFSSMGFDALLKPNWLPYNPLGDCLIARDDPTHANLRALVSRAFAPRSLERIEPRMKAIAAESADGLKAKGDVDFVADFAVVFPARVISEMVGVDPALHRCFRQWADDLVAVSPIEPPPALAERTRQTIRDMARYF